MSCETASNTHVDDSASTLSRSRFSWRWAIPAGVLVLVVVLLFGRTVTFDFAGYDEQHQLIENPHAHSISPGNIVRIFTGFHRSYYPIRLLSFALEHAAWGLNPAGYHLTNVVLHTINTLLVFWFAHRLVRQIRAVETDADATNLVAKPHDRSAGLAALIAGGLFAVHPVVVEPVTWVAGREELLMVLFAMTCAHLHLSAVQAEACGHRRRSLHTLTGVACLFASMSNAVAAIIPALITACDLVIGPRRPIRRIIAGVWFLWIIGAATIVAKILTGRAAAGGVPVQVRATNLSAAERIRTIFDVYWQNLRTLIWPRDLALRYASEIPVSFNQRDILLGLIGVVATLILLWLVRRHRLVLFGLLWFLLALAPSAQIMPHHIFRADRFFYLPLVGLAIALACMVTPVSLRFARLRIGILATTCVVLLALAARSAQQVHIWSDPVSLWENCARINPTDDNVFTNLGDAWGRRGDYDRALAAHQQAIDLGPDNPDSHYNRGLAYAHKGEYSRAIADFSRAIELKLRDMPRAYNNRGLSYHLLGEYNAAIVDLTQAIELQGDYADAYNNRGLVYSIIGQEAQALADLNRAIALNAAYANAYYNRGGLHASQQRYDEAIADLHKAIELGPMPADVHVWLGHCLSQQGKPAEAVAQYTEAARQGSDPAEVQAALGRRFTEHHRPAAAVRHFREALRLRPRWAPAANHLAWILATTTDDAVRNGAEAVRWAELASKAPCTPDPQLLDTLAAAYAEAGRFPDAVRTMRKAVELAAFQDKTDLRQELETRLALYESNQPLRAP